METLRSCGAYAAGSVRPTGVVLALAYSNTAAVGGTYTFALTERWMVGATAGWVGNSYEAVPGGVSESALSDNDQYTLGGAYKEMMKKYGLSENTLSRIIKYVEYTFQLEETRKEVEDGRL